MPHLRGRFVLLCQQAFAFAVVLAFAASAAGVMTLEIVAPASPQEVDGSRGSLVAAEIATPTVREVALTPGDGDDRAAARRPRAQQGTERQPAGGDAGVEAAEVLSPTEPVEGFATVGVTWDDAAEVGHEAISVEVRSRDARGWSAWQEVPYEDEHQADPVETDAGRAGTDAVVVGDVEDVQVRARASEGALPAGMRLALVDPGATAQEPAEPALGGQDEAVGEPDDAPAGDPAAGTEDAALSAAPAAARPTIYSRAQWGADERLRDRGSLRYGDITAGFVHHTVNANGYSRADVPSILRGIYAYHTQVRGWSDIGYNFLVDRFGRIWEGRYGGVARPVVGAHTLGYNDYSFAMSAIGNFETVRPSTAMLDAYGRLFAWKLALHGVDAGSMRQRVGSAYFPAVNGHRDAGSTACPGRYLYARLGAIRTRAVRAQRAVRGRIDANLSGSPWPDLVVRDAATKRGYVVRTGGQVTFARHHGFPRLLRGTDLVVTGADFNEDGRADLLARKESTGVTHLRLGNGAGGFGAPVLTFERFRALDRLTGVGDLTGDGNADLVGRSSATGRLLLYPGRGDGGFRHRRVIVEDGARYRDISGARDLSGDGIPDLLARSGRALYLLPGTGSGLGQPVRLPRRWGRFDLVAAGGDLTNDGRPDVVARVRKNQRVRVFPGDGRGGLGHPYGPFARFEGVDLLAVGGQLAGSRHADLVGRTEAGGLRVFANSGRRNIARVVSVGIHLGRYDRVLGVGDWNGDGHGDLMARDGDRLYLLAGNGRKRFAPPVPAGTRSWSGVRGLAAAGDVTGDGHPDLLGRYEGKVRVYPGRGRTGFGRPYVVTTELPADRRYDWLFEVGDLDGDDRSDLVGRARRSGHLWLLPGTKDGRGQRRLIAADFDRYDLGG